MHAFGSVSSDSNCAGSTPSTSAPTVAPSFLVVSVPMRAPPLTGTSRR